MDFHLAERLPQLVTADVLRAAVLPLGGSLEFYNPFNARSAALATMRATWKRFSRCPIAEVEAALDDPKRSYRKLIAPGGPVWLDVEIASANRDGEITRVRGVAAEAGRGGGCG